MKMVDTKKAALASDGVRVNRTGRRTYTAAYKLDVVRRCSEPGASVAAVAMAHGINANLVRRWIVRHQRASLTATPAFEAALLPVTIEAPASDARRSDDKAKPRPVAILLSPAVSRSSSAPHAFICVAASTWPR
jgi:transposase